MGFNIEDAAIDGDVAVCTDALATIVGCRQVDGQAAARNADVGIALDGGAIRRHVLTVDSLNHRSTRRSDVNNAAIHAKQADTLKAL